MPTLIVEAFEESQARPRTMFSCYLHNRVTHTQEHKQQVRLQDFHLCFPNEIDVDHVFIFVVLGVKKWIELMRVFEKIKLCRSGVLDYCIL